MSRVLITDFICVEAHRDMNINIVECFARYFSIDVISVNGYFNDMKEKWQQSGIGIINVTEPRRKHNFISDRVWSARIMQLTKKHITKNQYDILIALGFETLGYVLAFNFSNGLPVVLFHHKNIDELSSKIKRSFFRLYKNKVHHFVFEDFFANYMVRNLHIKKDKVHVVPHPVSEAERLQENIIQYNCVGLCNSNSEEFIQEVIDKNEYIKKNKLNIVLRSRKRTFECEGLKVIKGFLEEKTYSNYLDSSKTVLVAIPDTYVYRLSGSIYDALSRRKMVFTTSKYYADDYGKRYPGVCIAIDGVDDFIYKLTHIPEDRGKEQSFDNFIHEHSMRTSSEIYACCIRKILEELR